MMIKKNFLAIIFFLFNCVFSQNNHNPELTIGSGNPEKSDKINESTSEIRNNRVNDSIEKLLNEKTKEDEDKRLKLYFLIFIVIPIGAATIYLIILKKKRSIAKLELDKKTSFRKKT